MSTSKRSSSSSSAGGPSAKKTISSSNSSSSSSGNERVETVFATSTFNAKTCVYTYCGGWVDVERRVKNLIKSIVIEEGVTEIASPESGGDGLFSRCTALTSITFPENDTFLKIGTRALRECTSLTTLTVPDSCVDIEDLALLDCTSLESFTFPNKCTKLNQGVLYRCTSLRTIILSDDYVEIGHMAVESCPSLTTLAIPNACTQMHEHFDDCTALKALADEANLTIEQYCHKQWRSPRLFAFKVNHFASYNALDRIRVNDPELNDPLINKSSILWVMYDRITSDDVRRNVMEFLDYRWMGNR